MSAIFKSLRWAGAAVALAFCASSFSQTFEAPSCGTSSSDSTCYTINGGAPSSCSDPHSSPTDPLFINANQQTTCGGPGYVGTANQDGHRNICTGATTWLPLTSMNERCTNCPNPLTASENQAMVGSTIELAESINLALANMASSGFSASMLDGTVVNNPATGMALGRYFREHVWVSPEAFSSNQLPAVPRLNYLASIGQIPADLPTWIPQLPLDPNGHPINNTGMLYKMMLNSVIAAGTVTCSGNDASHCDISCTSPAGGWLGSLCATENVQYYSCSDSYAVYSGGTWIPTPNATVPFTSSAASGAGDYSMKVTDWGTIFGWNGQPNTGGTLFMCDSNIAACNGWVTQTYIYECRTPATIDCSYTTTDSLGNTLNVSATCATCDVARGAFWDYLLTQQNDCPVTPVSTRSSDNRNIWLSDIPSSCPVLAGPTGPSTAPTCPAGQRLDGSGNCVSVCAAPSTWDVATGSCVAPLVTAPAPVATCAPLTLSVGVPISGGAALCTINNGATITSVTLNSGTVPSGLALTSVGSAAGVNGTPTAAAPMVNPVYDFAIDVAYAAGVNGSGQSYPAGSITGRAVQVTLSGCDSKAFLWNAGASTCAATVSPSGAVGVGLTPSLASDPTNSLTSAGASGTDNLSCDPATGSWTETSSTCASLPLANPNTPKCMRAFSVLKNTGRVAFMSLVDVATRAYNIDYETPMTYNDFLTYNYPLVAGPDVVINNGPIPLLLLDGTYITIPSSGFNSYTKFYSCD